MSFVHNSVAVLTGLTRAGFFAGIHKEFILTTLNV